MSDSVRPHRRQPTGSPVPGILQARTLEWVAISFSNAWKWKVKGKSLSRVRLLATPWTAAYQAPPSMVFARQEYWSGVPLPSPVDWAGLQISNSKSNMQFSRQHWGTCLLVSIQFDAKWFFLSQEGRNIFYNQEKSLYYSGLNYRVVFMYVRLDRLLLFYVQLYTNRTFSLCFESKIPCVVTLQCFK